ncbi:MAG: hypothetical protein WCH99_14875 [Verrucomicrobiota bacterium]
MPFIYLEKFGNKETIRVNPDDILLIKPHDEIGSMVSFKDGDSIHFSETKNRIEHREWMMRYFYPNLEKLVIAMIGGVIGSLVTMLVGFLCRLPRSLKSIHWRHDMETVFDFFSCVIIDCKL